MYARRVAAEAVEAQGDDDYELCCVQILREVSRITGGAKRCPACACRRARACVSPSLACIDARRRRLLRPRRGRAEAEALFADLQAQRRAGLLDADADEGAGDAAE
jgi:hypothetical protein